MEYNYPKFTPEMKKTHTILIPNMAITQFRLLEYACVTTATSAKFWATAAVPWHSWA